MGEEKVEVNYQLFPSLSEKLSELKPVSNNDYYTDFLEIKRE